YAVRALLARVYLYKNDKVNALKNATVVILSHKYPWVGKSQVATTTRESRDGIFLPECIFMLNNTKLETITEKYLKESKNNDGNLLVSWNAVIDEIFESSLYGGTDWRYIYYFEPISWSWGNSKLWQVSSAYNNRQPLIRISEMYLIAAECAGSKKEALEYFNTLRQHRGFAVADDLKEDTTDEQLQAAIAKEYQKEFIGEGQWFFYSKRTDQETPSDIFVPVPFSKDYYVLPMPDQEVEYGNRN
ncbi:MAG: RagB/SusD family nutrient uptake outer membrane protein, partial [Odoribacter sp.]|nr:RagB/SusD family nutrient uptake outer membrane protein [Odoribacter sp.]